MSDIAERTDSIAVDLMRKLGFEPDPWQIEVLDGGHKRLLLNCCRQAGKSTVVAVLSLVEAFLWQNAVILLLSRSHRQSQELFGIIADLYKRLGERDKVRLTRHELELAHHSRIISLPCQADTIRGYSRVHMLVIDEAARVPDDLYRSVRPMLAVSDGRLICLSTPHGKRGFFHEAWSQGGSDWRRIEVPANRIARITPEFLEEERRAYGPSYYRQEYCCSFESVEGLVYPDFARCVVNELPAHSALTTPYSLLPTRHSLRKVGGIDFGFRNPFAAVWGVLDRDDVLWITGEHYVRDKPLSHHVRYLPRDVTWYADPSEPGTISELRCAGFTVHKADNAQNPGLSAVHSRIEAGTLKILGSACPNLVSESELYQYEEGAGKPAKEYDHALDALRYLILKLDARRLARKQWLRQRENEGERHGEMADEANTSAKVGTPWLSVRNEELWRRIFPG
jgi:hypothetical protein